MPSTLDQLLEIENLFWESADAPAVYETRLREDAHVIMPYGVGVLDKRACVEAVRNGAPWDAFTLRQGRASDLGPSAAALHYVAEARRGATQYRCIASSVYVRDASDAAWLLVLHQQTPSA